MVSYFLFFFLAQTREIYFLVTLEAKSPRSRSWQAFFLFFFKFYFYFILLYNTVLVLPYIDMNPPWVYTGSPVFGLRRFCFCFSGLICFSVFLFDYDEQPVFIRLESGAMLVPLPPPHKLKTNRDDI